MIHAHNGLIVVVFLFLFLFLCFVLRTGYYFDGMRQKFNDDDIRGPVTYHYWIGYYSLNRTDQLRQQP